MMTSHEDIEFEEAWATYVRLQSNHALWQKIKARERFENDWRLKLGGARREGQKEGKIETAQNLKNKGYSVSEIARMTGLPSTEIERLG
jgi:predicted transposase/invertase (TIGR01784 family)